MRWMTRRAKYAMPYTVAAGRALGPVRCLRAACLSDANREAGAYTRPLYNST